MKTKHFFYLEFLFLVLIVTLMLTGCAGWLTGDSYVHNPPPTWNTVMAIAEDASEKMSILYPAGHTQIKLVYPTDKDGQVVDDAFSASLENGLRLRGFTITPLANLRLAWHLDVFPEIEGRATQSAENFKDVNNAWYLRLTLANTEKEKTDVRTLTRMYDSGGVPIAGFAEQAR